MGLLSNVRKLATPQNIAKAKQLAGKNADKITGVVDKATTTIDQRTGGRYRDKLDKVGDAVERNLEKAKDEGDDGNGTDRRPGRRPR
jgi:hypothetical protein